ncbi:MAG: hypothetical protein WKF43_08610 [Acidimicrobiales bacterium]
MYSLAATLHAALTGRPPFAGLSGEPLAATVARIVTEPTPDLRPVGVPDALAAVIERAMVKDPGLRTATAEQLGAELASAAAVGNPDVVAIGEPRRHGRRRPATLATLLLLGLVIISTGFAFGRRLVGDGEGTQVVDRPAASTTPAPTAPTDPVGPAPSSTNPSEPPPTPAVTSTPASPPSTSPPSTSPPSTGPPSTAPSSTTMGTGTTSRVPVQRRWRRPSSATTQAVDDRPRDEMFDWLTIRYQNTTSFDSYTKFWNGIRSVTATNVEAKSDALAWATLTYVETSGDLSVERVELGLVRDDATGTFLIDSYRVR